MATRPAKATGTSRPRRAQDPAEPAAAPREPAAAPREPAAAPPRALRLAAAVLAAEAVGMCVAAGFSAVATADGQSYQRASGVALTLIAIGTAAVFAVFARGVAKARPWTRTPVVMAQLFVGVAGIYLMDGRRFDWGVPTLLLAACCLAALFTPASLRALNRS
jgi:ABC-type uncharacterized transport system permease subunit